MTKPELVDKIAAMSVDIMELLKDYPTPEAILALLLTVQHVLTEIRLRAPEAVLPEIDTLTGELRGVIAALLRVLSTEDATCGNGHSN